MHYSFVAALPPGSNSLHNNLDLTNQICWIQAPKAYYEDQLWLSLYYATSDCLQSII